MTPLRILILEAQVPFVHGGAEILVRELAAALTVRGHQAQIVSVPFRDYPKDELFAGAEAWRLLDVTTAAGGDVDLVIPTKFPTYFAKHPRKVLWLVHQHRAAYELAGTRFSDFAHTERDVALRRRLIETDTRMLRECVGHFTIARTVSDRMLKYNGIMSEALYNPPKLAGRLHAGPYGDYVLTVTRLEHVKRVDLTIDTFEKTTPSVRLLIAGDGSIRHELSEYIERRGLRDRVTLLGRVDDEQLIELYAGCRAVLFAPYQEDYGYVTLEAFLSRKPVITARDSGGTLEFVADGVNGYVCEPTPDALAETVNRLAADPALAASLGERGHGVAAAITWDHVVDRLIHAGSRSQRVRDAAARGARRVMRTRLRPEDYGEVSPKRALDPGARRRIVVAEARVPFARDGAELHAQSLVTQLRLRGHDAESVALPFHGRKHELLEEACAWRMINLSSSNARPIDLLIATRFPTWCARHPRKAVWLIHQHRAAYDLFGTPYSDFTSSDEDTRLRAQITALDSKMFAECQTIVTNARNTADRVLRFNGVAARPLYHPPPLADRLRSGPYGDYILVVSRLEPLKRVDLAIGAMAHVPAPIRLVIVGDGSQRAALEREAAQSASANRITFAGAVWGDAVADVYAGALAVLYAPFDEDYGYVTLEAFLAAKPVITATDSGGTLEFVRDGVNGLVCPPDAAALATAIAGLAGDRSLAERLGHAGQSVARTITWDGVIEQLLG